MPNADPESQHNGAIDLMGEAIDEAGWVEHLGEGMFVAQNNIIVFSNRQASEIMRFPNEELLRSDPVQWIHADDQAMVMDLRLKLRDKK